MGSLAVRLSLRVLWRHRKLAAIAIGSLAIGLASSFVGLSMVRTILMRPPALGDPDRLLTLYAVTPDAPFNTFSYPHYRELRDRNHVFSGLAAIPFSVSATKTVHNGKERNSLVNAVSDNYFQVLGASMLLGRGFTPGADDSDGHEAVLSYPYWLWLGADRRIVGQSVTINDVPLTIVGVTPERFVGTILTDLPDVWEPLSAFAAPGWRTDRQNTLYSLIGRLRPGVGVPEARAELAVLSQQMALAHPDTDKNRVAQVTTLSMLDPGAVSDAKLLCVLILAVVGLVFLAACTNVANLLLALSSLRRQEFLIRAALGAGRTRLVGQLLVDAGFIAGAGSLLGFGLATLGLRRLMDFKPYMPGVGLFPLTLDFRPNLAVLMVMLALVLVVAAALGLLPGLEASRADVADALRGEVVIGPARRGRMRQVLVGAQLFACTLVLVGVGVCLENLHNLRRADLGFVPRNVAMFNVGDGQLDRPPSERAALLTRLRDAVSARAEVDAVSLSTVFPLGGTGAPVALTIDGGRAPQAASVPMGSVDGAYFATVKIPVIAGRVFRETDLPGTPPVALVNRTMAQRFWSGADPVGQTVTLTDGHRRVTVIGVVADSAYGDIGDKPTPYMYVALSQHPAPAVELLVRTRSDARAALTPITTAGDAVDTHLSVSAFGTLEDWIAFDLYPDRFALDAVGGFGLLGAVLTAIGLYGAVFYSVSGRTRELGVRVALGATPRDLTLMILRQAATVSAIGITLGLGTGIAGTALVASWLYGVQAVAAGVLAGVALVMLTMVLVMTYSAARPWLHVDPLLAVRQP